MAIDWNDIKRRFDPWIPPSVHEVPRLYAPRPEGLASDLVDYLGLEASRKICLLVGQRSSGKTTELLRVMDDLQKHYLVVFLDLGSLLPFDEFGIPDVLFALGAGLYRTAESIAPGSVNRGLYTDLVGGLGKSVQKWVEKQEAGLSVPKLAKAAVVLTAGFIAGQQVAEIVERAADKALEALNLNKAEATEVQRQFEEEPRPAEVLRCLTAIIEALENEVAKRPLLILADGLNVARPDRARDVVRREDILSALPCRAAIVAPPYLEIAPDAPSLQKLAVVRLPNLPVTEASGVGDLPDVTFRFFGNLVARRLPEGLNRADILADEELARFARMSGGVIRDFVRLIHDACTPAARGSKPRLDRDCAEHGISELAGFLGPRAKVQEVRATLLRVAKDHVLPQEGLDLLHHNLVLLYRLGRQTWYDVHPVVREGLSG